MLIKTQTLSGQTRTGWSSGEQLLWNGPGEGRVSAEGSSGMILSLLGTSRWALSGNVAVCTREGVFKGKGGLDRHRESRDKPYPHCSSTSS